MGNKCYADTRHNRYRCYSAERPLQRYSATALQRYEEDNTTRDYCADQCHAEGLFVWAEGRILQAPSVTSYSGKKDPWHGHAFGFVYKTSNAVAEPPGVYSTPPGSERKTKPSDLCYPSYQSHAPWPLLCPSCSLSCLLLL